MLILCRPRFQFFKIYCKLLVVVVLLYETFSLQIAYPRLVPILTYSCAAAFLNMRLFPQTLHQYHPEG